MFVGRTLPRKENLYQWARTSGISYERVSRILIGTSVLGIIALGFFGHHYFYILFVGLSLNLIQSGLTDKCLVKNILVSFGFLGERDLGKRDVLSKE